MKKERVLTGIRPTGDLSIANYIGAIKHVMRLQKKHEEVFLFVADLHALTDNDSSVFKHNRELIKTFLALGINPEKVVIYRQSDIAEEIGLLTLILSKYVTTSELMRLPTLKEKLKSGENIDNANTLLLLYPVMMTADILIQRSEMIPVGKDQLSHLEIARKIARRYNKEVSEIFPEPSPLNVKAIKILSLRGDGKMSKSNPSGAIFLNDSKEVIIEKIKKAQTGVEGKSSPHLVSMKTIVENLGSKENLLNFKKLLQSHKNGERVAGQIKSVFTEVVLNFISNYQQKFSDLSEDLVDEVIENGAAKAKKEAKETMRLLKKSISI